MNPLESIFRGFLKPDVPTLPAAFDKFDVDKKKRNIFQNNELYFQKCKDLEEQVDYLQKINNFLVSQTLQTFNASTKQQTKPSDPVRKKSMKFEDDRSLNRTFQLFKIFKGLLENGEGSLSKISKTFFPETFDFESDLYAKQHQSLLNLILKASINSLLFMNDALLRVKTANPRIELIEQEPMVPTEHSAVLIKQSDPNKIEMMSLKSDHGSASEAAHARPRLKDRLSSGLIQRDSGPFSDGLSLSHQKAAQPEEPLLSDSFLNATDIKNNLLKPLTLPQRGVNLFACPEKIDKAVQVHPEELSQSGQGDSKDDFQVV